MIEMASCLDCSVDTLERRFADRIKTAREKGKMSLRRKQFEVALNGDKAMLIWLGKQYLEQREAPEVKEVQTVEDIVYDTEWGGTAEPQDEKNS